MKESEIRPAEILNEYLRLSATDAVAFFPDPARFVHRPCPGCGTDAPRPAFVKNGFELSRCGGCGTLYVVSIPEDAELDAFYRDSPSQRYWASVFFPAVAEARRLKIFRPRVERLRTLLADLGVTPRRVMDVGAGTGIFLEEARTLGFGEEYVAVEPNADLAATCREKGFSTFEGFGFEAAADPSRADSADLAVSFEVIEHVASPMDFIGDLGRLVRPGGLVVVSGLCGNGFDIAVLSAASKAVAPPHHLNFLSRCGVADLLSRCGLEEVAFVTPGVLDVDIVRNTLIEHPDIPVDAFIRHLALDAPETTRAAFQHLITDHGLSSHMWVVARRPE